ncbi:hypothetical protein RUM43_004913 [Polyplax serrata]|uniref:Uncharacterized protein n=1 Tax=Polyplax serrata TaxID=468196 RepID=A0AAN8SBC2_POLSC
MPLPADSVVKESDPNREGARKKNDLKGETGSKHPEGATFSSVSTESTTNKALKKTGIPRVKPMKLTTLTVKPSGGLSPPKKDTEKHAAEDKHNVLLDKSKKAGSVVMDKPPIQKKAQRAKGSTTIKKANIPVRSRPTSSVDYIARAMIREDDDFKAGEHKSKTAIQKSKISVKGKDTTEETKPMCKQKFCECPALDKEEDSKKSVDNVKTQGGQVPKQGDTVQNNEPNMPASTCSFFEKLQQGVRSYFASKNSVRTASNSEEPTKPKLTEGGIH